MEDYTFDFVLIGSMLVGELEQKTNIRLENVGDFEICLKAIDNADYNGDDVFLQGGCLIK